jgi:hypothetical protein
MEKSQIMKKKAKENENPKKWTISGFVFQKLMGKFQKRWKMMKKVKKCQNAWKSKKLTILGFYSGKYEKMSKTVENDEKGSNNVEKRQKDEESRKWTMSGFLSETHGKFQKKWKMIKNVK